MECEKIRDRFSSLLEGDLNPLEEKILREHLASCPECQNELERFDKTMRWLHFIEEVEVPDEFLSGIEKKMEDRKRNIPLNEKVRGRWLSFPLSVKLPIQAVAMVTIVFLVLYLTKMMPMEVYRMKDAKQPPSPLSPERKSEQIFAQKEMDKDRRAMEIPPEIPHTKDVGQVKNLVPGEEKLKGAYTPQVEAEAKKSEVLPKAEIMAYQTIDSKEAARAKAPSPEPGKIQKELVAKEKSVLTSRLPQEIILRISDREKVIFQVHELVKQFGGEIVTTGENMLLASLPTGSFSKLEKELVGLSASTEADELIAKKHVTRDLRAAPGVKIREVEEKGKELGVPATEREDRITVRILLLPK